VGLRKDYINRFLRSKRHDDLWRILLRWSDCGRSMYAIVVEALTTSIPIPTTTFMGPCCMSRHLGSGMGGISPQKVTKALGRPQCVFLSRRSTSSENRQAARRVGPGSDLGMLCHSREFDSLPLRRRGKHRATKSLHDEFWCGENFLFDRVFIREVSA